MIIVVLISVTNLVATLSDGKFNFNLKKNLNLQITVK